MPTMALIFRRSILRHSTRCFAGVGDGAGMHTSSARLANNMPQKVQTSVPLPPYTTLEKLGLDVKRRVEFNSIFATTGDANVAEMETTIRRVKARGIEIYKPKPRTPGLRWLRRPVHRHLWKGRPIRKLTIAKRKTGGRNHTGRITARHIGGGHKRRLRILDFNRKESGLQTVVRVEYDPGRTAHIALLCHDATSQLSYILAPDGVRSGDKVESFRHGIPAELTSEDGQPLDSALLGARTIRKGNCMPLSMVPIGSIIHAIGLLRGGKAKLCRSAGAFARLLSKHEGMGKNGMAIVRLKSGEERLIPLDSCATIGMVSNAEHQYASLGKAGRSRWLGRRPHVRGVAMNACDHPHGGGRGKTKGNKPSQSPWGQLAKGFKTRRGKHVNKLKVRDRPRGKDKKVQPLLIKT
ncbi:translation protein SH3-like domain-containing protein [Lipomyces doorenjongii]|uniref:mitochondrial 54S ribosomal protein uL2m n=1 Tax=Lipomyces doorenjongii TaxID=383834 RepID=UPI0034CF9290